MENLHIVWHKEKDGTAIIYRISGLTGYVEIPERINGITISKIADYCFSGNARIPDDAEHIYINMDDNKEHYIREICGEYPEGISLPDTVTSLGSFAFYNCRNLKWIEVGCALKEIGCDVFMNCTCLHNVYMRCSAKDSTGLQHLLARISWDVNVTFEIDGKREALFVYPEYFETYDEIAPAHIFGRNIEGEGFRARQCFDGGVLNAEHYDRIFAKACVEENKTVLYRMAAARLVYPFNLTAEHRNEYERMIKENDIDAARWMVSLKSIKAFEEMQKHDILSIEALGAAISQAAAEGWSEGAAYLMKLRHSNNLRKKKSRYEF